MLPDQHVPSLCGLADVSQHRITVCAPDQQLGFPAKIATASGRSGTEPLLLARWNSDRFVQDSRGTHPGMGSVPGHTLESRHWGCLQCTGGLHHSSRLSQFQWHSRTQRNHCMLSKSAHHRLHQSVSSSVQMCLSQMSKHRSRRTHSVRAPGRWSTGAAPCRGHPCTPQQSVPGNRLPSSFRAGCRTCCCPYRCRWTVQAGAQC